jgi:hypothetical protein
MVRLWMLREDLGITNRLFPLVPHGSHIKQETGGTRRYTDDPLPRKDRGGGHSESKTIS